MHGMVAGLHSHDPGAEREKTQRQERQEFTTVQHPPAESIIDQIVIVVSLGSPISI
jgi:hypothetical protein